MHIVMVGMRLEGVRLALILHPEGSMDRNHIQRRKSASKQNDCDSM